MAEPGVEVGAFVPGPRALLASTGAGPLDGLTLGVKDIIDMAGVVTSFGSPDWAASHTPAVATAPVVTALIAAGARVVGKTRTVELAYGMTGENPFHGTPINPAAPDRFPGGSSCGSAAGVAAGVFDIALGSDTGGSVRIPASYCGIFGIRPTHGSVSLAGVLPLAASLDTIGWFARDAGALARVGAALLPAAPKLGGPLLRVEEAWEGADPEVAMALIPAVRRVEAVLGPALSVRLAPEGGDALIATYRAIQGEEAWASLGTWVEAVTPTLSPPVADRIAAARATTPEAVAAGRARRAAWRSRMTGLLGGGVVLVFPTAPTTAPLLTATEMELQTVRSRNTAVCSIAGLAGLPEVTLPMGRVGGVPVGLSLVAAAGRDRALLALAEAVTR